MLPVFNFLYFCTIVYLYMWNVFVKVFNLNTFYNMGKLTRKHPLCVQKAYILEANFDLNSFFYIKFNFFQNVFYFKIMPNVLSYQCLLIFSDMCIHCLNIMSQRLPPLRKLGPEVKGQLFKNKGHEGIFNCLFCIVTD